MKKTVLESSNVKKRRKTNDVIREPFVTKVQYGDQTSFHDSNSGGNRRRQERDEKKLNESQKRGKFTSVRSTKTTPPDYNYSQKTHESELWMKHNGKKVEPEGEIKESTHYDEAKDALVTNRESRQNIADIKGLPIPQLGKKINITINRKHHTKRTQNLGQNDGNSYSSDDDDDSASISSNKRHRRDHAKTSRNGQGSKERTGGQKSAESGGNRKNLPSLQSGERRQNETRGELRERSRTNGQSTKKPRSQSRGTKKEANVNRVYSRHRLSPSGSSSSSSLSHSSSGLDQPRPSPSHRKRRKHRRDHHHHHRRHESHRKKCGCPDKSRSKCHSPEERDSSCGCRDGRRRCGGRNQHDCVWDGDVSAWDDNGCCFGSDHGYQYRPDCCCFGLDFYDRTHRPPYFDPRDLQPPTPLPPPLPPPLPSPLPRPLPLTLPSPSLYMLGAPDYGITDGGRCYRGRREVMTEPERDVCRYLRHILNQCQEQQSRRLSASVSPPRLPLQTKCLTKELGNCKGCSLQILNDIYEFSSRSDCKCASKKNTIDAGAQTDSPPSTDAGNERGVVTAGLDDGDSATNKSTSKAEKIHPKPKTSIDIDATAVANRKAEKKHPKPRCCRGRGVANRK